MGHQIEFYAVNADLKRLWQSFQLVSSCVLLRETSLSKQVGILQGKDWLAPQRTIRNLYLAREEDLPHIKTRYVPAQKYWILDSSKSPVIHISTPLLRERILVLGRLYFQNDILSGDSWIDHSLEFRNWAKKIFQHAKRSLNRTNGKYIGTIALQGLTQGKLELASQRVAPKDGLEKVPTNAARPERARPERGS